MRPQASCDEAHRIAFGFSPPDDRYFATRLRDGLGERGGRPAGHGPSGSSAPGKLRKRSASGHAAANARRMRLAVSTTRAATFKRRRRSVANSAVANSRTLGMASRTVSSSEIGEDSIRHQKRAAEKALLAQEWFAVHGPSDAPLLPLIPWDWDRMRYGGTGGLPILVGLYARSISF